MTGQPHPMTSMNTKWLANGAGWAVLYGAAASVGLFFENFAVASLLIWGLLAILSLFLWEHSGVSGAKEWLIFSAVGLVVTTLSFALDCVVGKYLHPERGWVEAGVHTLGFLFTLLGVGVTACGVAGALRAWVLSGSERQTPIAPKGGD